MGLGVDDVFDEDEDGWIDYSVANDGVVPDRRTARCEMPSSTDCELKPDAAVARQIYSASSMRDRDVGIDAWFLHEWGVEGRENECGQDRKSSCVTLCSPTVYCSSLAKGKNSIMGRTRAKKAQVFKEDN